MSVNKVILLGNLGRDPELKKSNNGLPICNFSLATGKKQKDGSMKTEWHRCVSFGKSAEIISNYVSKGDQLYLEGELSYGSYEKDGNTVYTTDIIVNQFNFISSKKDTKKNDNVNNSQYNDDQIPF